MVVPGIARKEYELIREGGNDLLRVDANSWPYVPSIESSPLVMMRAIDYLASSPSVSRIIFNQRRNFIYNEYQVDLLREIASLYDHFTKQKKMLSLQELGDTLDISNKYAEIQYLIFNLLRGDPIGAYVEVKRLVREAIIKLGKNQINSESQESITWP